MATPEQTRREWIIDATAFFVEAIRGTPDDITHGIETALETYEAGSTAANAIYQGFDAARKQIIQRRDMQAEAALMLVQVIAHQHTAARRYH